MTWEKLNGDTVGNQIAEVDDKMGCEKLERKIRLIFQEWLRRAVGWQRKLQGWGIVLRKEGKWDCVCVYIEGKTQGQESR